MPHVQVPKTLIIALTAAIALSGTPPAASAAQPAPTPRAPQAVPAQPGAAGASGFPGAPTQFVLPDDRTATETREQFETLLDRHPPAVGRVFKNDPSLMTSPAYLTPYPALSAFLAQHPEISRNSAFFLENISTGGYTYRPPTREERVINMWEGVLQAVAIASVLAVIVGFFVWLIRTLMDYRRWLRLSKIQVEIHNKLFDRFTANEDLLGYIQTPAGRRFLEAAPIPVDYASSPLGSPARRVLWAVQVGLVLGAGALGLIFVSRGVPDELAQAVRSVGWLAVFLGAGFLLSGFASYLLSRKLGLFGHPPATGNGLPPSDGA